MSTIEDFRKQVDTYLVEMSATIDHAELRNMTVMAINAGGKRIRPILCMLGYGMFQPNMSDVMPQAAALEMFHTFSLVHDDIMDEAPVRRGEASIYHQHGRDKAILAGDVMLILAFTDLLKNLDSETSRRVLECYTQTAIEVCEGQMMDLDFESETTTSRERYMRMIKLKTSVLIGASLKVGAIIGGADSAVCDALYEYGVLQGLAFQVQDDILDAFGDAAVTGKRVGGDIVQDKKTLLTILCMEEMKITEAEETFQPQSQNLSDDEKINHVLALYEKHDVHATAEKIKSDLFQQANKILEKIDGNETIKDKLAKLSEWLLTRSH